MTNQKNIQEKEDKTEKLKKKLDYIDSLKSQFKKTCSIGGWLNFFNYLKIAKLKREFILENNMTLTSIGSGNDNVLERDIKKLGAFSNYLVGTDWNLNPIYVNNLVQHAALFGGSGSGKSVFLFNLLRQVLEKGGGGCFVDGKGDLQMFAQFKRFVEDFGRLEDLLVINFNMGVESNSFNMFEALDIKDVKMILESIAIQGEEDFFTGQAKTYLGHVFSIMKYLKDQGATINLRTYEQCLDLKVLVLQKVPPDPNDPSKPDENVLKWSGLLGYREYWINKNYYTTEIVAKAINKFVDQYGASVNLTDPGDPTKYECKIEEQLQTQIGGYAAMALNAITNLSKDYDNIFNASKNDINFSEVISQNKFVYVIIPNMKISETMANAIGSFVINALKNAVGFSLGDETVTKSGLFFKMRPEQIKANPPFLLVFDELTAFVQNAKRPIGDLLSQARSVGTATIVSSQDINSLSKGNDGDKFIGQIFSNTTMKVFLKIDDDGTRNQAKTIVMKDSDSDGSKVDEYGNNVDSLNEDVLSSFLQKAKNGIGIIKSAKTERFLTPYVEPKSKNDDFELNR
jgi:hypothetical protein